MLQSGEDLLSIFDKAVFSMKFSPLLNNVWYETLMMLAFLGYPAVLAGQGSGRIPCLGSRVSV